MALLRTQVEYRRPAALKSILSAVAYHQERNAAASASMQQVVVEHTEQAAAAELTAQKAAALLAVRRPVVTLIEIRRVKPVALADYPQAVVEHSEQEAFAQVGAREAAVQHARQIAVVSDSYQKAAAVASYRRAVVARLFIGEEEVVLVTADHEVNAFLLNEIELN